MKILVTGGSGFIGSWLANSLSKDNDVTALDISSNKSNLENKKIKLIKQDLSKKFSLNNYDIIYHYAACPDVRLSGEKTDFIFKNNILSTYNLLEAIRKSDVGKIIFASTSAVYGHCVGSIVETQSLKPISNYGSSKVAGEALIQSYASTYGFDYVIIRHANIFGPKSRHGVIWDFYHKLKKNPKELLILGNGLQNKSYLYITDTLDATLLASKQKNDIFNIGSDYQITVNNIAKIVADEMNLGKIIFSYSSSGKDPQPGWKGDVPSFLLDASKIKKLGWKQKINTEDGIRKYVRWMIDNKL